MRSSAPPSTTNSEAQALIRQAREKCAGCRTHWRVDKRDGYRHRRKGVLAECKAATERAALREIAARGRKN